ncbi:uncharacterized protein CDAR_491621 [Caerostris darwini]|uniref:Uncharacterized protein n=1 Tax=Caerostris darwini TaxID=1538125 RepID=A0AAV4T2Z1_9ARAC|nr:uncharacterized protein CDAR_491621 [Caerostris darwini]
MALLGPRDCNIGPKFQYRYCKHLLKPLVESVEMFPNQDLGIYVLVANFKTKVRVAVLYAKPGSSDNDIIDAIDESLDSKNRDYKIVLAVISILIWIPSTDENFAK